MTNEDLWALNDDDSSKTLVKLWEEVWTKKMLRYWKQKEAAERHDMAQFRANPEEARIVDGSSKSSTQQKTKAPAAPSIGAAMFICFWSLFIPATITKTIADVLQFVSPQLLR